MILVYLAALGYQVVALIACVAHLRRRDALSSVRPPVSILKPVSGADDHFYSAIVSHARISYPSFEMLFGVRDADDSALPHIRRLQAEFPDVSIRIVMASTDAPNRKVGILVDLEKQARHEVVLVNDSDIAVEPSYLNVVTAPLEDPAIGLVTCLYRATADSFPSKWEALGITTDFAPSTLVAPLVGVNEFGLGSTLAFRHEDLQRIGGFEAIAPYIADDYQLGKRISQSGKKVVLTRMPVETHLGAGTWQSVWDHQVRWARTIRASKGAYLGLPITNATLWALAALVSGHVAIAAGLMLMRMVVAWIAATGVVHDRHFGKLWPLVPLRDLWGFAVWLAGILPGAVIWRGKRLTLDRQGRIASLQ